MPGSWLAAHHSTEADITNENALGKGCAGRPKLEIVRWCIVATAGGAALYDDITSLPHRPANKGPSPRGEVVEPRLTHSTSRTEPANVRSV